MNDQNNSLLSDDEAGDWITTFADLMTLLLVFFVLLYSISTLSLEKFKSAVESIQISLGEKKPNISLMDLLNVPKVVKKQISIEDVAGLKSRNDEILKDIEKFITEKDLGDYIVLKIIEGKIIIQITGKILFKSGAADLNVEAYPILDDIIDIVREYDEYNVNIKGHTDNLPISTDRFPSNWELSAVRATTVLKYFIRNGISPFRLTATGYGDVLPIVPNISDVNRSKNRRVEFVLEKAIE